ncbi:HNH endonuclease [Tunicatimonas pelagia]|uniref:HNH endonuclease n=1 Tax=Tunicatimonas pelagia TaxID=931531 RepID=UPI00266574CB|nr:HNH endonuclease [Tunicatimonas pelagia]WKN44340.1 HNH endonuclease [Tunicatimonas pelagia]
MKRNVLLLNQDYQPLTVCSMERAFLLVFLNKAELLTEAENDEIRTVNKTFPCPAVIRLYRYVNLPYRGVVLTRQNVFKRDKFTCQYCGSPKNLTLDHVIPRSKGGKTSWANLVTACQPCNTQKGDRRPHEANLKLQQKPHRPTYLIFLRDHSGSMRKEWQPFLNY